MSLAKAKVLVTGASGFVGQKIKEIKGAASLIVVLVKFRIFFYQELEAVKSGQE